MYWCTLISIISPSCNNPFPLRRWNSFATFFRKISHSSSQMDIYYEIKNYSSPFNILYARSLSFLISSTAFSILNFRNFSSSLSFSHWRWHWINQNSKIIQQITLIKSLLHLSPKNSNNKNIDIIKTEEMTNIIMAVFYSFAKVIKKTIITNNI